MSRALDDLSSPFKPKAIELIARCAEAGIALMIIFTGRSQEEQNELYAQGRSKPGKIVTWTLDSKHVMKPRPSHPTEAKSDAIDVCPYKQFELHGPDKLEWDTEDPAWQKTGEIGQKLGLKWGVLRADGQRIDLGHFEE